MLQATSHQFLGVKNSANSGVFSCEDCEKDLLDEILRTDMFTYISKSEIGHITVPGFGFRDSNGLLWCSCCRCTRNFPL